jgi:predicted DNA-binding transcriptional regulator AlpA
MENLHSPYIRACDAAKLMSISVKTLYNNRYQNKGPKCYKVGRLILYKPEDVLAYVEKHVEFTEDCAA